MTDECLAHDGDSVEQPALPTCTAADSKSPRPVNFEQKTISEEVPSPYLTEI